MPLAEELAFDEPGGRVVAAGVFAAVHDVLSIQQLQSEPYRVQTRPLPLAAHGATWYQSSP